jgi:2',3'-cyclic-nucleotide 2'-phosphodiesterase (5'-nucleotidase family)
MSGYLLVKKGSLILDFLKTKTVFMKNIFLTLIFSLIALGLSAQSQLTVQISSSDDDQEEFLSGSTRPEGGLDVGSSDLELGSEATDGSRPQLVGLRFTNIDLPQGALILGARIIFTVDEPEKSADPSVLNIRIEDTDNAEAMMNEAFNISSRPTLPDLVTWNVPAGNWPDAGTNGATTTTPDLAALVQAIVNKDTWTNGNAILFTIEGTGTRTAESYDGEPTQAARLVIDYIPTFFVSTKVSASTDTQEEVLPGSTGTEGNQDVASSDLELGSESTDGSEPQLVGVRFASVDIPKGAFIVSANIQFTIDEPDKNADPSSLTITAEDADNPVTYGPDAFNISSRPTLAQTVGWDIPAGTWTDGAGVAGPDQRTPNLAALVQELVNKEGWAAGNAMAFTIQGTGTRTAESFSGSEAGAPRLDIQYVMTSELRVRVSASEDDQEEVLAGSTGTEGNQDVGSSDLELGSESTDGSEPQLVGIRFAGVDLPKGAQIASAYIQFTIDEADKNADPASYTIAAEDADNPASFTADAFNISARPTLAQTVSWDVPAGTWTDGAGVAGLDQRTSDISALVQALVNRDGWEPGNAMAFTIQGTGTRTAESHDGSPEQAPQLVVTLLTEPDDAPQAARFDLYPISSYKTGVFDEGAAEIVAYDRINQNVFSTNADANTVSIINISAPKNPTLVRDIDLSPYGGGVNSVAVKDSLVAIAIEGEDTGIAGKVLFTNLNGDSLNVVTVGFLPDMITFNRAGDKVLTANEGEPSDDYSIDPEGSVSIIDISAGVMNATVNTISLAGFNADSAALTAAGVRIYGPNATVAQDLEPEYITVTPDDATAVVVCQENNALIIIDMATETATTVLPLGYKDHSLEGNGFDASNRSDSIDIRTWPTLGMYQPDAIKSIEIGGATYLLTANEGDARDYDTYSEEARVADLTLDPTAYPDAATLQLEENLGRLNTTTAIGDTDGDGDTDQIYSYGARSFSIWDASTGALVWDSGDMIERITAELIPDDFNSNNDENDSQKSRSDDKGPEPEAIEVVELNGNVFALVGLERVGGVMVFDITDPTAPLYSSYVNNRDFSVADVEADLDLVGDLGVEDIIYIEAADSPTGSPMVITANEVSGTVSLFSVNDPFSAAEFSLRIVHNNDGESKLLPAEIDGMMVGGAAEFVTVINDLRNSDNLPSITLSSGDNFLAGNAFDASLALPVDRPLYDAVIMDSIGYDAIAIGNHDFDFGPDVLERFILSYENTMPPYLSANLDFSGEPGLQALYDAGRIAPRTIINIDGQQVGVIGLIYDRVASITSPRNVQVIMEAYETIVGAQVDSLKAAGVNKIILISHLQSINREIELAGNLTDIDVIIAGGGDELLSNDPSIALQGAEIFGEYPLTVENAVGKPTYIVTTPGEYKYVGNLEVAFDENGEIFAIGENSNPILVANALPDPAIKVIQDSVEAYIAGLATTVVAFTEVAMDGTRPAKRRFETNQGNLVADAFVWIARKNAPDLDPNIPLVGVQNSGGMRLDEIIPANSEITVKTVRDIMAFDNDMVLMEPMSPQLFKDMLENSVSAVENTDGRFLQISGFSFVWDTLGYPGFGRVQSAMLDDGTMMIENYEVVDGAPSVYVATNNFSAGQVGPVGDDFDEFRQIDLRANLGSSYFKAVLDYITAEDGLDSLITAAQYPEGGEGRIVRTGSIDPFAGTTADVPFDLIPIGTFETGVFDEGAAEIVAYDPASQRAFFTNADANTVSILDISRPSFPTKVADVDMSTYGGGINSVAVSNGVVAAAVEGNGTMDNGTVVFMDTDGNVTNTATVGVLPDMITFTPDGTKVVTANEGEPSDDYSMDPEGSVSIVDVATGTVTNITFESLNDQRDALIESGVRIFGPGASVAQDLEPEYVSITEDGTIAVVVLQENNAIARIDLINETLIDVLPLGYKNHGRAFQGFDASNRSAGIDIKPQPTLGMYQPDAMKSVNIDGIDYFVTANEGDARDYDTYSEEARVADLSLYGFDYPNAANLQMDENLGRLNTTTTSPTKSITTASGQTISGVSPIYSYGARSFSIWNANGELIFDSGDFIERKLAELLPNNFNSNNDENDSFKSRSDDKGPEPEAIEIAKQDDRIFALVGLERVGGIMVFDITNPTAPAYVSYTNNRDFEVMDATSSEIGDLGVEDIKYLSLADSPADVPLVLSANEVSGTITIFAVNGLPTSTRDIFNVAEFDVQVGPNPFVSSMNISYELKESSKVSINLIDVKGRFLQNVVSAEQQAGDFNYNINVPNLVPGTYYILVRVNERVAALPVIKQ